MTWLAPLLHGLWAFHIVRGELNQALTHAEEMETLGKTRGNLSALLLGKHERGRICLHRGEFTTARALFEQYNALREPAHRAVLAAWVVQDRHIYNLGELGLTLALQGYIERGGMRLNEALTEARELKHPLTLVVALNEAAAFENIFGSPDRARRYAEELAAFSREQGFPYWAATADTYRGRSLCALGHLEEGLDFITKGLLMYRATGAQIGVSSCLTEQAAAYGALDRPLVL
jgi:tetratricopeptide (TPR) repeat protein